MKNKKGKDKFNFVSNGNNNVKKSSNNNSNHYKNNNKNKNNGRAYYSNKNNNNKHRNNNVNKNSNNHNNNNNRVKNNINNNVIENKKNYNDSYKKEFTKKLIVEEEIEQLELDDDLVEEIKNIANDEVSNDMDLNDKKNIVDRAEENDSFYSREDSLQNDVFEKEEDVFFENKSGLNNNVSNVQDEFDKWYNNNIENDSDEVTNKDEDLLNHFENEKDVNNIVENDNNYSENTMNALNNFENKDKEVVVVKENINYSQEDYDKMTPFERFENNAKPVIKNNTNNSNYYEDNGIVNDIYGDYSYDDKVNNYSSSNDVEEEIEEYNVDMPTPVVHEEANQNIVNANSTINGNNKVYFSFQLRVALLFGCIVVLLGSASVLILKTVLVEESKKVGYEESTLVDYSACLSTNDPYKTKCLDSNQKYNSSNIKNIKTTFTYKANFDEAVSHSLSYHVVLVNRIYDKFDSKNIVYENEDVIVDKTIEDINSKNAKFDIDVDIDYKTYNDFSVNYIKKYSTNSEASLDAVLYITDGEDTRKVASINIPLNKNEFKITSSLINKERHNATIILRNWTDKDTRSIIIGAVFVLIAIVLMIRFTKLIMGSLTKKSAYEIKLHEILNEYDRLIVVARDGYESDTIMKIVKVGSFEELLDARNILNKPIIYSKINNVKSEFIVEDDNKIYKYVMKEADIH